MKIRDIIREKDWEQDSTAFKSKKTGVDPETGQISWDIEYTPLVNLRKNVEETYEDFKGVLKKYPDDQKLEKLFDVYASFKRSLKIHVNRKYGK